MTKHRPPQQASPHHREQREREQAFLKRAQAGEDVRDEALFHMLRPLSTIARRIHWRYSQQQGNVIEVRDLIQEACAEILAHFTLALTKEEPFAYLYRLAYWSMLDCVNERGQTIKTHPDDGEVSILSLDKPLSQEGVLLADLLPERPTRTKKYPALHKALKALPEMQRMVVQRHFGLFGYAPESLNQVSRVLAPHSPRPSNAYRYYSRALLTLRQNLSSHPFSLPQQSTVAGGFQS